jgi:predicted metal-dependent HD superfamily phosphohydrolase
MDAGETWTAAVVSLGGDRQVASRSSADLLRRYAEPHRRYHTTDHVNAVIRDGSWLAAEIGLSADERALLMLAACAHDVVYEAQPGEDERASAIWARDELVAAGLHPALGHRVEQLVLLTIGHVNEGDDVVAAALLDADLAILAADLRVYDDYTVAVRQEYAAVSDDDWRVGRARVLSALLNKDPLFLTVPARERWEASAKSNLRRELMSLGSVQ